jgi:hypothetical protein
MSYYQNFNGLRKENRRIFIEIINCKGGRMMGIVVVTLKK